MTALRVETAADGVALVLYDVPNEPVNTLRDSFQQEFEAAFGKLSEDPAVKAVVLASAKPDSFVVGADVEMLSRVKTATEATALARGGQQAMQRLEDLGKRRGGGGGRGGGGAPGKGQAGGRRDPWSRPRRPPGAGPGVHVQGRVGRPQD